ncbi:MULTISPECIES: HAD family hydrolase [Paraburkholderia]|jgi:HAD superfamily hydrolase (TIGR01509 family)|uniref:HAD family hydrolase n=1 Tax=Paraburkholderia TaxID=1822464 RepID=UPI0006D44B97|nr:MULTISPECIES: HAD family phosphatase [Paraburkholderia]ALP67313.1 HAD family hydrolase [Paraburkholderia caribensis]AUT57031.1 HAD family hydrolase [Paraburkholderia caribensis]MDR6381107.1 HAD superfamily hydrolase (TIGR01509 family) [Paraburkholderia caribensis]CAG9190458.1 HAD family hydrolase [Paraburkholderia caribensis]
MSAFPFDAVLFDCDGVLVDSETITNTVLAAMLGELGWHLSVDEAMSIFVGKTVMDEAPLIEAKTGVRITPAWLETFRARRNAALEREVTAIEGIVETVAVLHARLDGRIAVASGADRVKLRLQLAKAGVLDDFEGRIFSGQETPRNKPHPDVYLAAAAGLGVDPARCAVIEDTVTGATAGRAAGATVFGYSPGEKGHSSKEALRAVGVADVFEEMAHLPALLAGWQR